MNFSWYQVYLTAFLGGCFVTWLLTPMWRKLARIWGVLDCPSSEKHKKHNKSTPLLGGAAIFSGWLLAIIAGVVLVVICGQDLGTDISQYQAGVIKVAPRLAALLLGGVAALLLGLYDDVRSLKAAPKFIGQFLIALLAVHYGGVRITLFVDNTIFSYAVTVFWFMLLMNSINFLDNMDGLAAGTVGIALAFFTFVAAYNQQFFIAALAAVSTGAVAGFWCYNRSPASIFMGDSGSHFIGYLTAVISASTTYYCHDYSLSRFPVVLPLFILAIPLFDTATVVWIRVRNRKPFWIGDHNHISHRFLRMGLTRAQSVRAVHLAQIILSLCVLPLLSVQPIMAWVLVVQAVVFLVFISFLQYAIPANRELEVMLKKHSSHKEQRPKKSSRT